MRGGVHERLGLVRDGSRRIPRPFHQCRYEGAPAVGQEDLDAPELIARYFFEQAPAGEVGHFVRKQKGNCGGWEKQGFERYVKDFSRMASKGLFSFNTDLVHGSQGRYYLVAIPEKALHASAVPVEYQGTRVLDRRLFAT